MSLLTDAKGRFAETLISSLLEYAGYRVQRLGVEEVVSEVKAAIARGEPGLQLPEQLRRAPDFLVIDPRTGKCTLLEVKFRSRFDDEVAHELHGTLSRQVALWPEMITAIVCADVPDERGYNDIRAHVRLLHPADLSRLTDPDPADKPKWERLRMLGGFFQEFVYQGAIYEESKHLLAPIRAWRQAPSLAV